MQIRTATQNDFSEIANIYQHYVENTAATFEITVPTKTELLNRWKQNISMPFIVAIIDDELVGYAYVRPYHSRPCYRYTVENSVYVHHEQLGKGIGSALLAQLLLASRKENFKQVIARIALWDDAEASVNLHKKLGFVETGCLYNVGYKFGKFIDTLLMQKSLS